MQPEKVATWRWVAIGVLFTVVVVGAYALAGFALMFPSQKNVVHTKQLAAAVGSTDAVKIAEKQVVSDAAQNGITVTGFNVVFNHQQADGSVVVRLHVTTLEVGSLTLDVTLSKSVYTVQAIKRAG